MSSVLEKKPKEKIEYLAKSIDNPDTVLSRGFNVYKVIQKAEKSGKEFFVEYLFPANQTYIL